MCGRTASLLSCAMLVFMLAPVHGKGARPRPVPEGAGGLESVLKGIDTAASRATLQALQDAKLLTPPTVGAFLTSAVALLTAEGKDARHYKAAAVYRHLLVQYLRYSRQTAVLELLRRWASSGGLPEQRQKALRQLVSKLDIAAFVQWAAGTAKDRHKHAHEHPQARHANDDNEATRRNNLPVAAGTAAAPRPVVRTSKSPPRPAKPPSKSAAKSPDLKDPLNQLVEWSQRVKALGGKLDFLVKEKGPPPTVTAKNRRFLNVGASGFLPRRIGVVFHVFQFMDSKGFKYPPQAYRNGSLPAKNILDAVNRLYRYSGTNVQFYVKEYRVNTKKYPYLLFQNGSRYQECAIAAEGCLCRAASIFNANPRKYLNVFVVGSSSYAPLVRDPRAPIVNSLAFTAAIPLHADGCAFLYNKSYPVGIDGPWDAARSLKSQFVWLNWDRLDPLADNSPAAFNQGASSLGHEFGHAMGLMHTFQDGCFSPKSDAVGDTPPEDNFTDFDLPNSLCRQVTLQGRLPTRAQVRKYDSCRGDRYIDNIFNLMSYSPALCRLYLTRGQIRRMQRVARQFYRFEAGS